jgi:ubiquinone/menaquinone biosynthesis C-methylase UbiE
MSHAHRTYVPAAGRDWRLPFYDLIAKLLGADAARKLMVEQIAPAPGERVLEVGCGTGTLLLELKRAQPAVEVTGLDPDPKALALARRKAERAGVSIALDEGFGDALPYGDGTFDVVASSFMYHHLKAEEKAGMLREVRRVLKPGGRFHYADFAGPSAGSQGFIGHLVHAPRHLRDNEEERVFAAMEAAGLEDRQVLARRKIRFARVLFLRASAPAG